MTKKKVEEVTEKVTENEDVINDVEEVTEKVTHTTEYILEVDVYFQDKYDEEKYYSVGDTFTITDEERKNDIINRGLAHIKK